MPQMEDPSLTTPLNQATSKQRSREGIFLPVPKEITSWCDLEESS